MNLKTLSYSTSAKRTSVGLGAMFAVTLALTPALSRAGDTPVVIHTTTVPAISRSTMVGKPSPSQKLNLMVALRMTDMTGLEAYARAVNDRKSPLYRKFLTPRELGDRFGQTTASVATVTKYLTGKGLAITLNSASRATLLVSGTVKQVETAFGTTLANYKTTDPETVNRSSFYANVTAPKLPTSIASKVAVVAGFENYYRLKPRTARITPLQSRTLYNALPLYNGLGNKGEGVRIGIFNLDGFRRSNLPLFYSTYGLPTPAGGVGSNVNVVAVNGGTGETDPQTDYASEGDLDIQLALAQAPLCTMTVYDAPNSLANGVAVLARIQESSTGSGGIDIASESYGFPTYPGTVDLISTQHTLYALLAAQGVTYLAASGDDGVYGAISDTVAQNVYPDTDPFVTIVGGTVATINASGNRIVEDGWNFGGGGYSIYRPGGFEFNVRPDWQLNVGIPVDDAHNYRLFPDVALHAAGSNNGGDAFPSGDFYNAYAYVFKGGLNGVSGTSASCPTFAGQLALILQQLRKQDAVTTDDSGGSRLGFINPFLYDAGLNATTSPFLDITTGSNGVLPDKTASVGKVGYDLVTGLGVPNVDALYNYFLGLADSTLASQAITTGIFTPPNSTVALGSDLQNGETDPSTGAVDSLATVEGTLLSLQSVRQSGIGQVAAATIGIQLVQPTRTGANLRVVLSSPELTTGYVYLQNYVKTAATTSSHVAGDPVYDLVKTLTGNGSNSSATYSIALDTDGNSPYIKNSNPDKVKAVDSPTADVQVLVRAIKPARLGNVPFRLNVDQAVVVERTRKS